MTPMSFAHRTIAHTFHGFCEMNAFNVKHFEYQSWPDWVESKRLSKITYSTPPNHDVMKMLYGTSVLVKQVRIVRV